MYMQTSQTAYPIIGIAGKALSTGSSHRWPTTWLNTSHRPKLYHFIHNSYPWRQSIKVDSAYPTRCTPPFPRQSSLQNAVYNLQPKPKEFGLVMNLTQYNSHLQSHIFFRTGKVPTSPLLKFSIPIYIYRISPRYAHHHLNPNDRPSKTQPNTSHI